MPWQLLINPVAEIIKRVVPNKAAQDKAIAEFNKQVQAGELEVQLAQIAVNAKEAEHKSVFVAGGRPASIWICNSALAYAFVIEPLMSPICQHVWGFTLTPMAPDNLFYLLGALPFS